MPDEPIIVVGGSLKIKASRKLIDNGNGEYEYPKKDGSITGVTIDGKDYPVGKNGKIVIHYEVPDDGGSAASE